MTFHGEDLEFVEMLRSPELSELIKNHDDKELILEYRDIQLYVDAVYNYKINHPKLYRRERVYSMAAQLCV
jgi:hypothetical protein